MTTYRLHHNTIWTKIYNKGTKELQNIALNWIYKAPPDSRMEIQCYLYRTASTNINRIRGREGGGGGVLLKSKIGSAAKKESYIIDNIKWTKWCRYLMSFKFYGMPSSVRNTCPPLSFAILSIIGDLLRILLLLFSKQQVDLKVP